MLTKVLLYIPAYNCADQLQRTIEKIGPEITTLIDEAIVIDNNSTDHTYQIAHTALPNITVPSKILQTVENNSLGGSIKSAIKYGRRNGFSHILVLHGDDQADIRDFESVLATLNGSDQDLIVGARFHPKSRLVGYNQIKAKGNRALNKYLTLISKVKIYDLIAGLNIYDLAIFDDDEYLNFPNDLTFDAHLLLYSIYMNKRIEFVPITWREEDQVSNAKAFRQGRRIVSLFTSYAFLGKAATFKRLKPNASENYEYVVKDSFE
jgi:dolichol-phosphate mannosyltransferase